MKQALCGSGNLVGTSGLGPLAVGVRTNGHRSAPAGTVTAPGGGSQPVDNEFGIGSIDRGQVVGRFGGPRAQDM